MNTNNHIVYNMPYIFEIGARKSASILFVIDLNMSYNLLDAFVKNSTYNTVCVNLSQSPPLCALCVTSPIPLLVQYTGPYHYFFNHCTILSSI